MAKVTGIVYIKINGELLESMPGATLEFGGVEREPVITTRVAGYTEKVKEAMVSCKIAHTADTDLPKIGETVDSTLEFECDTGTTYVVSNAWLAKPPKLSGDGEGVELEFMGEPAFQA